MKSKKSGNVFVIRLEKGEFLLKTLTKFCEDSGVTGAHLFGLGAVSKAELSYYSLHDYEYHTKKFEGEFEVLNMSGNVALTDGKPFIHAHITLSDTKFRAFGGHLNEAVVGPTLEVFITPLDKMERAFDAGVKLRLLE